MVGRDQVPALALLAVGATILLAAAAAGYVAAQPPEYHHHVYPTSDPPDGSDVVAYDELSPEAQHVFQQALDDPDGTYTTTARADLPSELQYGDDPAQVYVRYDGATYGLVGTGGDTAYRGLYGLVAVGCVLVGAAFAGLGTVSYRRRSARIPLAAAGFLGAIAAVGLVVTLVLLTP